MGGILDSIVGFIVDVILTIVDLAVDIVENVIELLSDLLGFDDQIVEQYSVHNQTMFGNESDNKASATTIIRAIIRNEDMIDNLLYNLVYRNGKQKIKKLVKYIDDGEYFESFPKVEASILFVNYGDVTAVLNGIHSTPCTIDYTSIGTLYIKTWVKYWLQQNKGYDVDSNSLTHSGVVYTVNLSNIIYHVGTDSYELEFTNASGSLTPPYHVPTKATGSHYIINYHKDSVPATGILFIYKVGSGTYAALDDPTLDFGTGATPLRVLPAIPLRTNNVNYNDTVTTKSAKIDTVAKFLGLDADEVITAVMEDVQLSGIADYENKVDHVFITFGVRVWDETQIGMKYLFEFCAMLYTNQAITKAIYDAAPTTDDKPYNNLLLTGTDYKTAFRFAYITFNHYTLAEVNASADLTAIYHSDPSKFTGALLTSDYYTTSGIITYKVGYIADDLTEINNFIKGTLPREATYNTDTKDYLQVTSRIDYTGRLHTATGAVNSDGVLKPDLVYVVNTDITGIPGGSIQSKTVTGTLDSGGFTSRSPGLSSTKVIVSVVHTATTANRIPVLNLDTHYNYVILDNGRNYAVANDGQKEYYQQLITNKRAALLIEINALTVEIGNLVSEISALNSDMAGKEAEIVVLESDINAEIIYINANIPGLSISTTTPYAAVANIDAARTPRITEIARLVSLISVQTSNINLLTASRTAKETSKTTKISQRATALSNITSYTNSRNSAQSSKNYYQGLINTCNGYETSCNSCENACDNSWANCISNCNGDEDCEDACDTADDNCYNNCSACNSYDSCKGSISYWNGRVSYYSGQVTYYNGKITTESQLYATLTTEINQLITDIASLTTSINTLQTVVDGLVADRNDEQAELTLLDSAKLNIQSYMSDIDTLDDEIIALETTRDAKILEKNAKMTLRTSKETDRTSLWSYTFPFSALLKYADWSVVGLKLANKINEAATQSQEMLYYQCVTNGLNVYKLKAPISALRVVDGATTKFKIVKFNMANPDDLMIPFSYDMVQAERTDAMSGLVASSMHISLYVAHYEVIKVPLWAKLLQVVMIVLAVMSMYQGNYSMSQMLVLAGKEWAKQALLRKIIMVVATIFSPEIALALAIAFTGYAYGLLGPNASFTDLAKLFGNSADFMGNVITVQTQEELALIGEESEDISKQYQRALDILDELRTSMGMDDKGETLSSLSSDTRTQLTSMSAEAYYAINVANRYSLPYSDHNYENKFTTVYEIPQYS
jgi:hypothetical protein